MRKFLFFTTAMILSAAIKAQGVGHNGAVIAFSSTTFCYDTITRGSDGECAFEFTNVGDEPLVITSAFSSCGCTVPSWPQEPILPNQKGVIRVRYNTDKTGGFSKAIVVKSNSTDNAKAILRINGVKSATLTW